MEKGKYPDLYEYTNHLAYLRDYLASYLANPGKSYRSLTKSCGIANPGFFQQIVQGERRLTRQSVEKVAKGLKLTRLQTEYLVAMVAFEQEANPVKKLTYLEKMRTCTLHSKRIEISSPDIHRAWYYSMIWETLKLKDQDRVFSLGLKKEDVQSALDFFLKKGFISSAENGIGFELHSYDFKPSNDVRNIQLQESHLNYLRLAQHRLNDDIHQREFQGLTMAIERKNFDKIKGKIRDFVQALNDDYAVDEHGDQVVRVQCCLFQLAKAK